MFTIPPLVNLLELMWTSFSKLGHSKLISYGHMGMEKFYRFFITLKFRFLISL